jgi:hypothetical protein
MANVDTPFGLRAIGHPLGLSKARITAYAVASDYATALFPGDPVIKTSTANAAEISAPGVGTVPAGTMSQVEKATAGTTNRITGVIVGVAANPDNLSRRYLPASTGGIVFVNNDPLTEYEIQADGAIAATQIGLNAVLIYTNTGDTNTGQSGAELDSGTTTAPATTVGFQMQILGLVPRADNEVGANAKVRVRINQHTETNASTGI